MIVGLYVLVCVWGHFLIVLLNLPYVTYGHFVLARKGDHIIDLRVVAITIERKTIPLVTEAMFSLNVEKREVCMSRMQNVL